MAKKHSGERGRRVLKTVLRLPELDQAKSAVLNSLSSTDAPFLLGHVSIQTTERSLGCKQRIRSAVNDRIGIEPES